VCFVADAMCDLLRAVKKVVHDVNPHIEMGLMNTDVGENFYTFSNFEDMMIALDGKKMRPGGGSWDGNQPHVFFNKMVNCAYQIWESGPVQDIQYESENIPHLESKPLKLHLTELTASLMSGCNGLAIDGLRPTEMESCKWLLDMLKKNRSFLERLTDRIEGWPLAGGWQAYRKDAVLNSKSKDWFDGIMGWCFANERKFFEAGFSFTSNPKNADYTVLSDAMVDAFSEEELPSMFSGAVVMVHICGRIPLVEEFWC